MSSINKVDQGEVLREIGFAKYLDFRQTIQRLYGLEAQLSSRYAPSIVLKSEVEVWDISTPRFAIRAVVSVKDKVVAAINLRRIRTFCGQRCEWVGSQLSESPADIIRTALPIADSFFFTA